MEVNLFQHAPEEDKKDKKRLKITLIALGSVAAGAGAIAGITAAAVSSEYIRKDIKFGANVMSSFTLESLQKHIDDKMYESFDQFNDDMLNYVKTTFKKYSIYNWDKITLAEITNKLPLEMETFPQGYYLHLKTNVDSDKFDFLSQNSCEGFYYINESKDEFWFSVMPNTTPEAEKLKYYTIVKPDTTAIRDLYNELKTFVTDNILTTTSLNTDNFSMYRDQIYQKIAATKFTDTLTIGDLMNNNNDDFKKSGNSIVINIRDNLVKRKIKLGALHQIDGVVELNNKTIDFNDLPFLQVSDDFIVEGNKLVGLTEKGKAQKTLIIPANITEFENTKFDFSKTERIVFPENLTRIPDSFCQGLKKLKSVVLPKKLTYLGDSAFMDCTSLKEVNWSGNTTLTEIQAFAFKNTGLVNAITPRSVTTLKTEVFSHCTQLRSITTWAYNFDKLVDWNSTSCKVVNLLGNRTGRLTDWSLYVLSYSTRTDGKAYVINDTIGNWAKANTSYKDRVSVVNDLENKIQQTGLFDSL